MATEAPPPSYDSIVSKVRSRLQSDPTPEKVFSIVSNFSQVEANAVANADIDVAEHMSAIDQDKFNEGVNEYLRTEAARLRLEYNADEATNACRLIETMFNNLAVRLGQIDGMNLGKTKFMPRFKELQQVFFACSLRGIDLVTHSMPELPHHSPPQHRHCPGDGSLWQT